MVLASELSLDALLQRIADLSREVVGARFAAVGVLGDEGELVRFVHSGIDEETVRKIGELPRGRGVLGVLVQEDRPLRLREISEHPRSYGFPTHHPPMNSFLGVPISVRGRIFGRLYLSEKVDATEFSKDDERVALMLASQAGAAIENARLYEEVRRRGEELAVLEERERISRELHDGVIQTIYSVGLSLQGSMSLLERDVPLAKKRMDGVITELDNVVRDVRSYIFELQPKSVEEQGLSDAVAELVKELEVNTLAHATVELDDGVCIAFSSESQAHVVQIVREVLSNIARHARASEIALSLTPVDGEAVLVITDDGIGFDPQTVRRGNGLRNIQDRASRLGGTMEIRGHEPRGTRHLLKLPGHPKVANIG